MARVTKKVSDSALEQQVYQIFPNDLNPQETIFGGAVMAQLDRIGYAVAERHSESICVTASVDALSFIAPAHRGEMLVFCGSVNRVWHSSMEVGLRVSAYRPGDKEERAIVSAYMTFVALGEDGKSREVPELVPENAVGKRRYQEAGERRESRRSLMKK